MSIDYKQPSTIRESAVLTTSYVAGTVIGEETSDTSKTNEYNQLILLVTFTIGSLTSAELKVEFSPDGTTWYRESSEKIDDGSSALSLLEYTLTASGNYRIPIQCNDRYIRVSAKGTGVVTSSLLGITGSLGVN